MVQTELEETYHLSQEQIYNGGYVIRTTVDDKKMAALYEAVRENEAQINASSHPFTHSYMHAAAVLEDPGSGAIQAVYGGPGYIGKKYNGTGKVITGKLCAKIKCEWNMAVQNREQVGSSFKPYVLAAAVKAGMNVQTSTLNGFNNLYIAPDDQPNDVLHHDPHRPGPTSCKTTRSRRMGRTRRRSRWPCRSTPPTPTCGTGWAAMPWPTWRSNSA